MSVSPSYSDLFQARLMSVHSCKRAKVLCTVFNFNFYLTILTISTADVLLTVLICNIEIVSSCASLCENTETRERIL